jgi:hypothetical protein
MSLTKLVHRLAVIRTRRSSSEIFRIKSKNCWRKLKGCNVHQSVKPKEVYGVSIWYSDRQILRWVDSESEPSISVSIVPGYGLDDQVIRGSIPGRGERIFPLASVSRPALGPTQPPVQWVPGALSRGVKARPGRDADHSPPSTAEVENE